MKSPMEEYFRLIFQVGVDATFADFGGHMVMYSNAFANFGQMTWGNDLITEEFINVAQ